MLPSFRLSSAALFPMATPAAEPQRSSGGLAIAQKQDIHHVESATADGSSDQTDPVEATRILRKIDWRIIPLLQFLYMLTFLDRVNIGNARLWNLETDLGMSGYQYNIVVLGEFTALRGHQVYRPKDLN